MILSREFRGDTLSQRLLCPPKSILDARHPSISSCEPLNLDLTPRPMLDLRLGFTRLQLSEEAVGEGAKLSCLPTAVAVLRMIRGLDCFRGFFVDAPGRSAD